MSQVEAKCKFKQPIHKLIIKCHFKGSGSNLSFHPSSFLTVTQHSQPLFLTSLSYSAPLASFLVFNIPKSLYKIDQMRPAIPQAFLNWSHFI